MKLIALAIAAVALVLGSSIGIAVDGWSDESALQATVYAVGTLTWVGVGIYAMARRPHNRLGATMVAVGFIYWLGAPIGIDESVPFSIGLLLGGLFIGTVAHMLLAYPSGRLAPGDKTFVRATYVLLMLANLAVSLIGGGDTLPDEAPDNILQLTTSETLGKVTYVVFEALALALSISLIRRLGRRMSSATPAQRRGMSPVITAGLVFVDALAIALLFDLIGLPDVLVGIPNIVAIGVFIFLPFTFVFGLVRSRWFRAGAVGDLVERLNSDRRRSLRDALAAALGDESLQLAYWLPREQRYVDDAGRPVDLEALPTAEPPRAVCEVDRDGRRIGAILHDPGLREEPDLVHAAASAAALALENERLEAELRARVEELERSRAKVIEVSLAERRRLERDLHDGAQQRLVALGLQVSMARAKVADDPAAATEILDRAREELRMAQEELRELARGIHPAILTDRGLGPAVSSLVQRATVPVELAQLPDERLPTPVEAAAYFVVAESLTNVAKHAPSASATVRISRVNGHAVVEVSDDGAGGVDPARFGAGSGLRGLADRLAAVDGRLRVDSPAGVGTTVRAEIPCVSS